MARAAGISHAVTVRDIEGFKQEGIEALNEDTLRFVVCKVEESLDHRKIPRPNFDPFENKYRFVRYLERTEGRTIFLGRG